jgi:hypothetical protein
MAQDYVGIYRSLLAADGRRGIQPPLIDDETVSDAGLQVA